MTETEKWQNILRLLRHQQELIAMAIDNCDRIKHEIKKAQEAVPYAS